MSGTGSGVAAATPEDAACEIAPDDRRYARIREMFDRPPKPRRVGAGKRAVAVVWPRQVVATGSPNYVAEALGIELGDLGEYMDAHNRTGVFVVVRSRQYAALDPFGTIVIGSSAAIARRIGSGATTRDVCMAASRGSHVRGWRAREMEFPDRALSTATIWAMAEEWRRDNGISLREPDDDDDDVAAPGGDVPDVTVDDYSGAPDTAEGRRRQSELSSMAKQDRDRESERARARKRKDGVGADGFGADDEESDAQ